MAAAAPTDEGRHPPEDVPYWNESWYFDFATGDGSLGGYVRLGLVPGWKQAWYWAYLVGDDRPLVAVRDHDLAIPAGKALEVRGEGLWAQLTCETPLDHWSMGLEAFAVAMDDPADSYRGERGDRVALGLDLEWESVGAPYGYEVLSRYEVSCRVHGEVLVGAERIEIDGWGQRDHSWGPRDWWSMPWCWTAGRLDDGTAFHASRLLVPETDFFMPGYVLVPGADGPTSSERFHVDTETGDEGLPARAAMTLHDLSLAVTPLRHAPIRLEEPDGRISRFPRSLCRFESSDGRAGFGWTEWLQPQPS